MDDLGMRNDPLEQFRRAVVTVSKNTQRMIDILDTCERRFTSLGNNMAPIQKSTGNLTTAKRNIAATLVKIEGIHEYFEVASQTKDVIAAGLQVEDPTEFYRAVERVTQALKYLRAHTDLKSADASIKALERRLKLATTHCLSEFERSLRSIGKTITKQGDTYRAAPVLSKYFTDNMPKIAECMLAAHDHSFLQSYKEIRATAITNEIKTFNEGRSYALSTKSTHAYRWGTHPWLTLLQFCEELLRGERALWGAVMSPESWDSSVDVYCAVSNEVANALVTALEPILEVRLSGHESGHGYGTHLLAIVNVYEAMSQSMSSFVGLCEPEGRPTQPSNRLRELHVEMENTIIVSLKDLLDSVNTDPCTARHIPPDCAIHVLTGHVLSVCLQLANHASLMQTITAKHVQKIWGTSANRANQEVKTEFPMYIAALLDALLESLRTKSETYVPKVSPRIGGGAAPDQTQHKMFEADSRRWATQLQGAKRNLFMLNNACFILTQLGDANYLRGGRTSIQLAEDSPAALLGVDVAFLIRIRALIVESQRTLVAEVAGPLEEQFAPITAQLDYERSGKTLTHASGRVLKGRFGSFNAILDELRAWQQQVSVPDPALRSVLREHIKERIVDRYTDFYLEYSQLNFSKKHMGEYLRYPPNKVDQELSNLFDSTA